jgi:hypothetical protein
LSKKGLDLKNPYGTNYNFENIGNSFLFSETRALGIDSQECLLKNPFMDMKAGSKHFSTIFEKERMPRFGYDRAKKLCNHNIGNNKMDCTNTSMIEYINTELWGWMPNTSANPKYPRIYITFGSAAIRVLQKVRPVNTIIIALIMQDEVYSLEKKYGYSIPAKKYLEAYVNMKDVLEYLFYPTVDI